MKPRGKLYKAFAVAALAAGIMVTPGFVPQAHAGGSVVAAMSASNAAARRHDDEALSAAMANPSAQNIAALQARFVLPKLSVPFLRDALREMNLPTGLKADQVTEAQRQQLKEIVHNKWRVDYMSSANGKEAVAKGLRADFGRYFEVCAGGASRTFTYDTAKQAEECMNGQQWEHEEKPILQIGGGIVAGVALILSAAELAKRRKQGQQPG